MTDGFGASPFSWSLSNSGATAPATFNSLGIGSFATLFSFCMLTVFGLQRVASLSDSNPLLSVTPAPRKVPAADFSGELLSITLSTQWRVRL